MSEAEFAAWLHGSLDDSNWEAMQCLIECKGCDCSEGQALDGTMPAERAAAVLSPHWPIQGSTAAGDNLTRVDPELSGHAPKECSATRTDRLPSRRRPSRKRICTANCCSAIASGSLEQWSAGFAPDEGLALGPHTLVATRSATAMAASECAPDVGENGGLVESGTCSSTPNFVLRQADLVVLESQVSGRGQDPLLAMRLQGEATWPDGKKPDQLPSVPDMFPDAHGGRVCTLAVAIALLMGMVAISLSAWLWDRFCSMAELGRWSIRVAFQQHKRYKEL